MTRFNTRFLISIPGKSINSDFNAACILNKPPRGRKMRIMRQTLSPLTRFSIFMITRIFRLNSLHTPDCLHASL